MTDPERDLAAKVQEALERGSWVGADDIRAFVRGSAALDSLLALTVKYREAHNHLARALEVIAARPAGDEAESIGVSEYAEAMLKRFAVDAVALAHTDEGSPAVHADEHGHMHDYEDGSSRVLCYCDTPDTPAPDEGSPE